MNSLKDADYEVRQQIIWNKTVAAVSRSAYHWKHEPCWYAVKKGSDANWCGDRKQITVWDAASPLHIMSGSKEEKTPHPTQKPSLIYEIPIANHTNKKDGLYDPFSGSGTAFIACEKTGRRCFGMEIDPHYCDIIIARWEKYTGKQAKLTPINTEPVEV
jgi:DNA modification methylase